MTNAVQVHHFQGPTVVHVSSLSCCYTHLNITAVFTGINNNRGFLTIIEFKSLLLKIKQYDSRFKNPSLQPFSSIFSFRLHLAI